MYVLTVRFPSGAKTYDYLFVNPKGLPINMGKPLRICTGAGRKYAAWKEIDIVRKTKMDALPHWVTSQIVLDENNTCSTERISAEHIKKLTEKKSAIASSTKTKAKQEDKPSPNANIGIFDSLWRSMGLEEEYHKALKKHCNVPQFLIESTSYSEKVRQDNVMVCKNINKI